MTTHETLVAAKTRLLREGWRNDGKWKGQDGNGPYCVLGVLNRVCREVGWVTAEPVKRALADAAGIPHTVHSAHLMCWNDDKSRTFTEVIDAFDRAIWATAPAPTETKEKALA